MTILIYILLVLAAGAVISLRNYMGKLKYIKQNIIELWGKGVNGKFTEDDMENISSYFNNKKEEESFIIDDITWNDLDMNEIYKRINNTQSSVGEEVLYSVLREPLYDENKLKERDRIISYFENNDKVRTSIQYIIAKLGKHRNLCVSSYFYTQEKASSNNLILYRILSVMPLLSLALVFIVNKSFFPLLILSIGLNMYLHYRLQKEPGYKFQSFTYITSLIKCADKISKCNIEEFKDYSDRLKAYICKVKNVKNKYFSLTSSNVVSDAFIMSEYISIIFLTDVINFEKMKYMLTKNREDFKKIYEFVGILDSLIAIASYRKSLDYHCKPVLNKCNADMKKHLSVKDIYHPLIKNPVVNSCDIEKSILITGSNASGKSTFLKTLAINAIMAQTIYTCTAKDYASSYFIIYSSMALKDNILNNESYYIVEIKSLKRIIDNIDDEIPCLCFVDEILRGTNTVERISSSSEVLNYFGNSNCICVAATHDIELTHILEKIFDNYHFQENIVDDKITFDYKLYSGRAETRNAIKLLKFIGYKEYIVKRAEERAENFVNTGVWKEISAN